MSEKHIGKVIQVIGPVLDIQLNMSIGWRFDSFSCPYSRREISHLPAYIKR